jgi:hypothetical protein
MIKIARNPILALVVAASTLHAQTRVTTEEVPRLIKETEQILATARAQNEGFSSELAALKARVTELQKLYHSLEPGEEKTTAKAQLIEAAARVLYAEVGSMEGQIWALDKAEGNLRRLYDYADRLGDEGGKNGSGKNLFQTEIKRNHQERQRIEKAVDVIMAELNKISLTKQTREVLEAEYRAHDRMWRNVDKRDQKLQTQMVQMGESYKEQLVRHINNLRSMLNTYSNLPFLLDTFKSEARLMIAVVDIEELSEAVKGLLEELGSWEEEHQDIAEGSTIPLEVFDPPDLTTVSEIYPETQEAHYRTTSYRSR